MKAFVFSGGGAYAGCELGIVKYILEKNLFEDSTDLAIGTSFGAISAGSLALQLSDDAILDMFADFNSQVSRLLSGWSLAWSMISFPYTLGWANLEMILGPYFGGDPQKTSRSLITVSTDLKTFKPVYFTNALRQLEHISILESIAASASIPLVFEPLKVSKYICVDGGIMNNFPVNLAEGFDTVYAFGSALGNEYYNAQPTQNLPSYLSTLLNGAIYRLNVNTQRNVPLNVKYCPYASYASNMLDFSHYSEDITSGYDTAKAFFEKEKE
ncbi:MAG: patatin-like phospholipase family protein [Thermotogae bacterium]|jgi:NTE family protein|nr:patatin-like phospholipase family protein [Thermotogota bacterium]